LTDPTRLPADLVETMHRCGARPGHARALRSLSQHWRSWIVAREAYPHIRVPVTSSTATATGPGPRSATRMSRRFRECVPW
jgi:hypothetical protein